MMHIKVVKVNYNNQEEARVGEWEDNQILERPIKQNDDHGL